MKEKAKLITILVLFVLIAGFKPQNNQQPGVPKTWYVIKNMNVFYAGVDNPIKIHGAKPGDQLRAKGLSVRKGKSVGEFVVRAMRPTRRAGIMVIHTDASGKVRSRFHIRVKRLPYPTAFLLGKSQGLTSKGRLRAASFLKAEMVNFDFNLVVKVTSFTMSVLVNGKLIELNAKGPKLNAKMKAYLNKVQKGDKVFFENIKVRMPDGTIRKINPMIFKVK